MRPDNGNGPPERAPATITTPPPSAEASAHRIGERDGPVPLWQAIADLLALSDERDTWLARLADAFRAGWRACWPVAYAAGYRQAERERDRQWREAAAPVARGGPSFAELERRRWSLRGEARTRETFGRPHPDDFTGKDGAA